MPGPLHGVKIIDLSRDLAGSYACMLLGDMGAEVTKVEDVDGDPLRSEPSFQLWNRGRRSVALSLRSPQGREVFHRLVARSDVLVETFLSAEARELGVDFGTLAPLNHGLVYCALPPFGETGPLAGRQADDGTVSAYVGVYGDQGGDAREPMYVYFPMVSYGTAFLASFAISSALYAREMTGEGQKVEVPWYAAAVAMQSGSIVTGPNVTYWGEALQGRLGANPAYSLYRCRDGWLSIACGNTLFWNRLCIALGLEHLVEDSRFQDAPWSIPVEHRDKLWAVFAEKFEQRPRNHWLELLTSYDVPGALVETQEKFIGHPRVENNRMFAEVDDPVLGKTVQMALPVKFSETPGAVGKPAPALGQDTEEIMAKLGHARGPVRLTAAGKRSAFVGAMPTVHPETP
jgi:crotonobetainyl-CoA:carnitine CoA-transferase CaiB-like acyl-CoA transferase